MSNDNAKQDTAPQMLAGGVYIDDNGEATSMLIPGDGDVKRGVEDVKAYRNKVNNLRARRANGEISEEEAEQEMGELGDRFGTGGLHTARDRSGATGWREGTELTKGPDPDGVRDFKGDEFDGIIGYARSDGPGDLRKPAFWSHFTQVNEDGSPKLGDDGEPLPITHVDQLKGQTFKVCLPKTFPEHLKGNPSIEGVDDAWGRDPKTGKVNKPEDRAVELNPRLAEQAARVAADSEASGLKVEIVDDPNEAHVIMMGWDNNSPRGLIGFASFPESMNSWPRLRGLGQPRGKGFLFVNNAYAADERVTDDELRDLVLHESMRGHNMGGCHPHDLGMLHMSQNEALASTLMSYSTIHGQDFDGTEGGGLGYIDYGARDWHPNPKDLNTTPGIVYDMQKHMEQSFEKNKNSPSAVKSGLLPGAIIINHGEGAELHGGTAGNNVLDTNPGYCSSIETPPIREGSTKTLKQKVMLKEGQIAKVIGRGGNNTIIASERGDQEIEPGEGKNTVALYYHSIGGNKTITSIGEDTLVLSENILMRHNKLQANQRGSDMVLGDEDYSITLKGNGLANIRVVDNNGQVLLEQSVKGLSAEQINETVLAPAMKDVSERHGDLGHKTKSSFTQRVGESRAAAGEIAR